ncbi:fumarylacetoacetate hydrolase family protein [Pseudomonas benzopyrenica]|uniref:Fumarylacetoacetate hydrolase family protein n=1 Tax=Pseudomonas benzopyrenica TaxID=2993566 RepID=A0ABZ2FP55_9PSED
MLVDAPASFASPLAPLPAPPPPASIAIAGHGERFTVGRVFCLGRNYGSGETPAARGATPLYFMKPASAVMDARGEVPFPPATTEFCHEVELVVALGRGGFRIPVVTALEHVWGYAVGLDMTRRDLQARAKAEGQSWEAAKGFDGAAPIGPLVPVAQCGHPAQGAIWLAVNGEERQRADLGELLWSVAEAISLLSGYLPLRPGDLLMTGTPPGVAPLAAGDVITAGIAGLGRLDLVVGHPPQPWNPGEQQ